MLLSLGLRLMSHFGINFDFDYNRNRQSGCINKIIQYSYVMKRAIGSQQPKPKSNNKNKGKSKHKSKEKKFNPLEYLNALIDQMKDYRFDANRKRGPLTAKRELSSALAYATPVTDHTINSSKVRSRSSYSQYRKKSVPLKDVLRVNVGNAITEENDVIQFTEASTELSPPPNESLYSVIQYPTIRTRAAAARKIQRAWRNYQTLKVVKKYYEYYKNMLRRETEVRETQPKRTNEKLHFWDSKPSMERTLKIRKTREDAMNSSKTARMTINEVARNLQISLELDTEGNRTKELLPQNSELASHNEILTVQLTSQAKDRNDYSQEYSSRDMQLVIELLRHSHDQAARQINLHLDNLCQMQSQTVPMNSITSEQSQQQMSPLRPSVDISISNQAFSPTVFIDMERTIAQKYDLMRQKIERQFEDRLIEGAEVQRQMEQLKVRMKRQISEIERFKQQYQSSMEELKKNVLKLNVDSSAVFKLSGGMGRSVSGRVRKCYSADTLILKSIVDDAALKFIDLELHQNRIKPLLLPESPRVEPNKQEEGNLMFPTSPPSCSPNPVEDSGRSFNCYEYNASDKLREQLYNNSNFSDPLSSEKANRGQIKQFNDSLEIANLDQALLDQQCSVNEQKESDSLVVIQECSEQLQELIEQFLVQEVVEEIYMNSKFYSGFRPSLEPPYTFRTISDDDIACFLEEELPPFYSPPAQLLQKLNQKINPSTLEILRLIRDIDFQIDEYELVLPEEVFKGYRIQIEQQYAINIRKEQAQQAQQPDASLREEVAAKVMERGREKKGKKIKFLSFERDLKIMYMKSVFNCYNEFIIETKSFSTFMNARSSIGPGELSLALREYNCPSDGKDCSQIMLEAKEKVGKVVREKCMLPVFKNFKDLEHFQQQVSHQIEVEFSENEFKWVNFMDEVLEIWHELSLDLIEILIEEATLQVAEFL